MLTRPRLALVHYKRVHRLELYLYVCVCVSMSAHDCMSMRSRKHPPHQVRRLAGTLGLFVYVHSRVYRRTEAGKESIMLWVISSQLLPWGHRKVEGQRDQRRIVCFSTLRPQVIRYRQTLPPTSEHCQKPQDTDAPAKCEPAANLSPLLGLEN